MIIDDADGYADACLEGDAIHQELVKEEVAEAEKARAEAAEKPSTPTGRVVVEISQPAGRARTSFGGRRREKEEAESQGLVATTKKTGGKVKKKKPKPFYKT